MTIARRSGIELIRPVNIAWRFSIARQPKHRDPIINAAVSLFRRQGYSGTGLNDIVDVSGAPKGSLYHFFPGGKPAIAVAAVETAGERLAAALNSQSKDAADTRALLRAYATLLSQWRRQSSYRDGCPMTTVLLELAPADREVSRAGRAAYRSRIDVLSNKLVEDGFEKGRADRLAQLATSALQGALIQARVERSDRPIKLAIEELEPLLRLR